MTGERYPAEHFSPGEYIAEGLEGRGKTEMDVVKDTSFTLERIHGIIYHEHAYTRDEAQILAEYFDTSAELWVNLLAAHIAGYMEELKQCIREAE